MRGTWWLLGLAAVLLAGLAEGRRRRPGGTCGLSCYRSLHREPHAAFSRRPRLVPDWPAQVEEVPGCAGHADQRGGRRQVSRRRVPCAARQPAMGPRTSRLTILRFEILPLFQTHV
jgi:hypothetical protein